jgi:hypothetical protein
VIRDCSDRAEALLEFSSNRGLCRRAIVVLNTPQSLPLVFHGFLDFASGSKHAPPLSIGCGINA